MIKYYKVAEDIGRYPNAWCYLTVGGRATGKTYNALLDCLENKRTFFFIKRTIKDVDNLCRREKLNPFRAINRDTGREIKLVPESEGFGYFQDENEDVIGYVGALSGIGKFTGFDLYDVDWLIFDEYIPRKWDRFLYTEGQMLLDLYMTVSRDRELKGRKALKLICLANATTLSNPVNDALQVTDTMADMMAAGDDIRYIKDREIVIHILQHSDVSEELKKTAFYKGVNGTKFGSMAFDNAFSNDDFSLIGKQSLKGYRCKCKFVYQNQLYYLFKKGSCYYITKSSGNTNKSYDLDSTIDQSIFYHEYGIDLHYAILERKIIFESFSVYDLILNYKKHFKIS